MPVDLADVWLNEGPSGWEWGAINVLEAWAWCNGKLSVSSEDSN